MQFRRILILQRSAANLPHHADDEIARADKRVDDVNARVRERAAKLSPQNLLNASRHKIDNRLRRIDDAVRIGNRHGKALKKLLIDRVEEVLLLRKVVNRRGRALNSNIEAVEAVEKIAAVKRLRGERVDDLLDLVGNDVAAREIGIAENRAKNPLSQQMLNEHLLDRRFGQIGIDGLPTLRVETRKGRSEAAVVFPLPLDQLRQPAPNVGHLVLELADRLIPFGNRWRPVRKKGFKGLDELLWIGQIGVENGRVILPQNPPLRRLKEDVVAGIPGRKLALHFGGQVVVRVFGLPIAVRQIELVDQRTIDANAPVLRKRDRMLRHERPPKRLPTAFEQRLKRRAHRSLMRDAELLKGIERFVVRRNRLVRRLEIEGRHSIGGRWLRLRPGSRALAVGVG